MGNQHTERIFKVCIQCGVSKHRNLCFTRNRGGDSYADTCRDCGRDKRFKRKVKVKLVEPQEAAALRLDAHWRGCSGWDQVVQVQQRWRVGV